MPLDPQSAAAPSLAEAYDVFLSYNTLDRELVHAVAGSLREQGLKPFLDIWYLKPGGFWAPELERVLAACRAVAVFIGPHGLGPWQQREAYVALERQSRSLPTPVIPVLLPQSELPLGFLRQSTWVDLRGGVRDELGLKLLVAGIRGEALGPEGEEHVQALRAAECPYRGLLHFREEDAPFFFGREAAVERLVEAVSRHRFLAVVGASGCGKSSVVRAGLAPALRRARDTVWEIAALVPGEQPLKALADALTPLLFPELDAIDRAEKASKLAARFAEGDVYLRDLVTAVLGRQTGTSRLLLVVDQWEELYTLARDDATRRRFIDGLLDATEHAPCTVALTLRGDFVGQALACRPLSDRLQGAQVNLGPMTRAELQRAIEQPAGKVGLRFEAGLVARILEDVGDEPGNLPLLEFVLRQLWDARRGALLTNQAYDDMGRLQGAIARRADKFYEGLSLAEQEVLKRLFLQLVHATADGPEARRRERLANLPEPARPLIERLSGGGRRELGQEPERLLVIARGSVGEEETVEVAHEALIRNWQRLVDWLRADREFLLWRERFRGLLGAWQLSGGDAEGLLQGAPLDEAGRWFAQRAGDLNEAERQFIGASLEGRRLRREAERRQQQRLKRLALTATVLAVLAIFASLGAGLFWGRAERNRRAADGQVATVNWQLAQAARGAPFAVTSVSLAKATHHLLRAAQAAQAAGDRDGALNAAWAAHLGSRRLLATLVHSGGVLGLTNSPDHTLILSWCWGGAVRLWRAANGEPVNASMRQEWVVNGARFSADGQRILSWNQTDEAGPGEARLWQTVDGQAVGAPMEHAGPVTGALFSADRQRVLTWSEDDTARLWQAANGQPIGPPMRHEGPVNGALFCADGQRVLTWSEDGTARLWQAANGQPVGAPMKHEASVGGAVFSADGQRILSWSSDGTARLWRTTNGQPLASPMKHDQGVGGARFSPDGRAVLTWGEDGTARLWRATDGRPAGTPMKHAKNVRGARFDAAGQRVLTWSEDGTARLWLISNGQPVGAPMRHETGVNEAAFSPDGQRILTWSEGLSGGNGEVRLWQASDGQPVGAPIRHESVGGAVFSADGQRILSWSSDGTARLWQASDGQLAPAPMRHAGKVQGTVFSADGQRILSWGEDGTARLWQATNGQPASAPMKHAGPVSGGVFSPDEKQILTWSADGTARLWRAADGQPAGAPMHHDQEVMLAAFSADGQRVLTWSEKGSVRLWQAANGQPVSAASGAGPWFYGVVFSADRQRILGWSNDGTARLWRAADGQPVSAPMKHEEPVIGTEVVVMGAVFSADERQILTWSNGGWARLWGAPDGSPRGAPLKHEGSVDGAVFRADGQRVLTWSQDGTARLWRTTDGQALGAPLEHAGPVAGAVFSADGHRILSWSADGTARLWGADNQQLLAVFRHPAPVNSACFDKPERRLLTAGDNGALGLWDVSFEADIPIAERLLEFEVRSATTLEPNGEVRILTELEWAAHKQQLAELRRKRGAR